MAILQKGTVNGRRGGGVRIPAILRLFPISYHVLQNQQFTTSYKTKHVENVPVLRGLRTDNDI